MTKQAVFQVDQTDNVATVLRILVPGAAATYGDPSRPNIAVAEKISTGHRLALRDIVSGENITKCGVMIGCATKEVKAGQWVHLHDMKSLYDTRSSSPDVMTGAPTDTHYE